MNTTQAKENHLKAIEMIEEIERLEKMRDSLTQDANSFPGENFPDKKAEWLQGAERYQKRIDEAIVEYKMHLNSIR